MFIVTLSVINKQSRQLPKGGCDTHKYIKGDACLCPARLVYRHYAPTTRRRKIANAAYQNLQVTYISTINMKYKKMKN